MPVFFVLGQVADEAIVAGGLGEGQEDLAEVLGAGEVIGGGFARCRLQDALVPRPESIGGLRCGSRSFWSQWRSQASWTTGERRESCAWVNMAGLPIL